MNSTLKHKIVFLGAAIGWFAIIVQFVIMMQNRVESLTETTIRFFSYFTILTNGLVALYFSVLWYKKPLTLFSRFEKPGFLTATTLYIATVGIVYQLLLRHIWEPTAMQKIVDELLHSVIPIYVFIFWIFFENKKAVAWKSIPSWLLYPLFYLVYILLRGQLSGYYPYPFLDVAQLGWEKVLRFCGLLFGAFTIGAFVLVALGKFINPNKR
nr:Pr6Pr family membrane protein [uncultured Flavobacterium sp.]